MSRRPPEYDVCLNAHPVSAHAAKIIARFFRSAGLRVYHDEVGEGSPRLWAMHHAVAASRGYLVLLGEGTPPEWARGRAGVGPEAPGHVRRPLRAAAGARGFPARQRGGPARCPRRRSTCPTTRPDVNNRLRELAARLRDDVGATQACPSTRTNPRARGRSPVCGPSGRSRRVSSSAATRRSSRSGSAWARSTRGTGAGSTSRGPRGWASPPSCAQASSRGAPRRGGPRAGSTGSSRPCVPAVGRSTAWPSR
jgi:hypothetical protein